MMKLLCTLAAMLLSLTMTPGKRYTDSLRWDVMRALIRKRDGYQCRECGRQAEYNGVWLEVHHRRAVTEGGGYMPWNLRMLCKPCHDTAHGKIGDIYEWI